MLNGRAHMSNQLCVLLRNPQVEDVRGGLHAGEGAFADAAAGRQGGGACP